MRLYLDSSESLEKQICLEKRRLPVIRPWIKKGVQILKEEFGKRILVANFLDPLGRDQNFLMFEKPNFSVILPITATGEVVAIRQYYQGAERILLTLPGGNMNASEYPSECIRRELLEETGYQCSEIIQLGGQVWPDPRYIPSFYCCFLGLGCEKFTEPHLESTEEIEIELIPLKEWLSLSQAEVEDQCAVVTTHRALPLLQERNLL